MSPSILVVILSTAGVLLFHVAQTSGKCSGDWALHSCRGGNVKRADVDDRQQPLLDRLRAMEQKSLGSSGQYLDTSEPNLSGNTRLKLWIAHRLLTAAGDTKGRNDIADLAMRSLPSQKQAIRGKNRVGKVMSQAQEHLVRLLRMRGDTGDSQVMPERRVAPTKYTGSLWG